MLKLDLKTRFQRTLDRSKNVISGKLICRQLTNIVDDSILSLYNSLSKQYPILEQKLCLVPVGGYGRMELCPHSDIDILYLHDDLEEPVLIDVISIINTFLYDSGKQVGHSCRTIEESIYSLDNFNTFNSILDSRLLAGSERLYIEYTNRVVKSLPNSLIDEFDRNRIQNLNQMIESQIPVLVSEPNIKQGLCGQRDIQNIYWIEKIKRNIPSIAALAILPEFSRGEVHQLENAYDFYLRVRIALHVIDNRKNDRLSIPSQLEVAEYLGFGSKQNLASVDKLMSHLYTHQKSTYNFIATYLDYRKNEKANYPIQSIEYNGINFQKIGKYLYPPYYGNLFSNPETFYTDIMTIFYISQIHHLELSPILINELRIASNFLEDDFKSSKKSIRIFMDILENGQQIGKILTAMHDCNILGKFIPEFGACTYLSLFSYHHEYPVDEHTLYILRELDKLIHLEFEDKQVQKVFEQISSIKILVLAILVHDAGKVKDFDHCQYGAELATSIGERLGLSDDEIDLYKFIVEHHIIMSELSSKRDITDPDIIANFAKLVGNENRLNLLYIFTIIDTKSVGPNILTNWKKSILYTLYANTLKYMEQSHFVNSQWKYESEDAALQTYILQKEKLSDAVAELILRFAKQLIPVNYLSYNLPRRIVHQFSVYATFQNKSDTKPIVEFELDPACVNMTVYSKMDKFLLSDITGTISASHLNVISMRSFRDDSNFVITQIQLTDTYSSGNVDNSTLEQLESTLSKVLFKELKVEDILSSSYFWTDNKIPEGLFEEKIEFNNDLLNDCTILEIRLPDSLGLLYRIIREILSFNVQLDFVKVATSADYAYDSFYLKNHDGQKILDRSLMMQLRDRIQQVAIVGLQSSPSYIEV